MRKNKVYSHRYGPFYYKNKKDDPCYQKAMEIKNQFESDMGGVGPVRTLKDMSIEEIIAIETQYGCKISSHQRL